MKKINKKGFTLIELLVVIAIIGLLSTLSVVSLNNAREKSRNAKRVSDIKNIQTALELYYNDNSTYPASLTFGTGSIASITGTYMTVIPSNPTPRTDGTCTDTEYIYYRDGAATYHIHYCLGSKTSDVEADWHHATPGGITDD
jgi:type II secretion system protein G